MKKKRKKQTKKRNKKYSPKQDEKSMQTVRNMFLINGAMEAITDRVDFIFIRLFSFVNHLYDTKQ